ncbi:hypothetical protein SAMN05421739_101511 [Pontibacter chinhatensis]|uniref:Uncharacterized protein n=1 Tax=Pontibacter chinhatensis TaxID=1436961 RepID=A0A1I2MYL6_9BACT|nr:hypothetical protein SAMN05421739_101511 [Pontibacter chinhatensis]
MFYTLKYGFILQKIGTESIKTGYARSVDISPVIYTFILAFGTLADQFPKCLT